MGNSLQKDPLHTSRFLQESSEKDQNIERPLQPDFSRRHQTTLSRLNPKYRYSDPSGYDYFRDDHPPDLKVFENLIIFRPLSQPGEEYKQEAKKSLKEMLKNEKLYQWKSFKQLDLWIWDEAIEHLLVPFTEHLLSRFQDLRGIHLVCKNSEYYSKAKIKGESLLNFVEKVTKRLPHLTQFEIMFTHHNQITNLYVKCIIRQILKNLPHLEVLTLYFDECQGITKECFEAFGFSSRRTLPNLKKLRLFFGIEEMPDFKFNFDLIFPNLESLNLNFSGFLNVTDQDLITFASNTLSKLHYLQELTFILRP